jgi:hypothetical protein
MFLTLRRLIMSMPLAMVGLGRGTGKPLSRLLDHPFAFPRTALIRAVLLALVAVLGCGAIPGPAEPPPAQAACVAGPTKGNPEPVCHDGEFTGRYYDGLPVYAFPTIYVVGHRAAD